MKLESHFDMNQEVEFIPMYAHQKEFGIAEEVLEGVIKGIKFTEAKVFYDVYNPYWGKIFSNVSSEKVFKTSDIAIPQTY